MDNEKDALVKIKDRDILQIVANKCSLLKKCTFIKKLNRNFFFYIFILYSYLCIIIMEVKNIYSFSNLFITYYV